jgi:hypothetical protein
MTAIVFCGASVPGDCGGPEEACGKRLPCSEHSRIQKQWCRDCHHQVHDGDVCDGFIATSREASGFGPCPCRRCPNGHRLFTLNEDCDVCVAPQDYDTGHDQHGLPNGERCAFRMTGGHVLGNGSTCGRLKADHRSMVHAFVGSAEPNAHMADLLGKNEYALPAVVEITAQSEDAHVWSDADLVAHFAEIRVEDPRSWQCAKCGDYVPETQIHDGSNDKPCDGRSSLMAGTPCIDNIGHAWIEDHFDELVRLLARGAAAPAPTEMVIDRNAIDFAEHCKRVAVLYGGPEPSLPGMAQGSAYEEQILTDHLREVARSLSLTHFNEVVHKLYRLAQMLLRAAAKDAKGE